MRARVLTPWPHSVTGAEVVVAAAGDVVDLPEALIRAGVGTGHLKALSGQARQKAPSAEGGEA